MMKNSHRLNLANAVETGSIAEIVGKALFGLQFAQAMIGECPKHVEAPPSHGDQLQWTDTALPISTLLFLIRKVCNQPRAGYRGPAMLLDNVRFGPKQHS